MLGRVGALRRYPVKSLVGESLARARFTDEGLDGDRRWAVVQPDGGVLSARRIPALLQAHATVEDGRVVIDLPSGERVVAGETDADEALSRWLGTEVRLASPSAERPVIADVDGSYEGRAGSFFDAAPILLVTTGTLEDLASRYPEGRFDARRFRPNLVIETDEREPAEQTWLGARIQLGSAVLSPVKPCRRCVMTTLAQEDLPLDKGILRTVAREVENTVGIYATVEQPGSIAVGDPVTMLG